MKGNASSLRHLIRKCDYFLSVLIFPLVIYIYGTCRTFLFTSCCVCNELIHTNKKPLCKKFILWRSNRFTTVAVATGWTQDRVRQLSLSHHVRGQMFRYLAWPSRSPKLTRNISKLSKIPYLNI